MFDPDEIAFVEVIARSNSLHTLALDQQGRLWAWGANANGQLGLGDTTHRNMPTLVPIEGLSGVTSFDTIIAGGNFTLALDQQGRLWAWGANANGQLGLGDTTDRHMPTLVPLADLDGVTSFDTFAAGTAHTLALDQQGRLWAWGNNGHGRLGLGDITNRNIPTLVPLAGLSGVSSFDVVAAGSSYTFAFDQQGRLWAWGFNASGQLGLGDTTHRDTPTLVPIADLDGVTSFNAVVVGTDHAFAFDQQGRLWVWGSNGSGRLGLGDTTPRNRPTLVPLAGLSGVSSFDTFAAGTAHTLALDQQGRLWAWGLNTSGQLGLGDTTNRNIPTLVPVAGLSGVSSFDTVIAGVSHILALDQQGRLWAWGLNTSGQLGDGTTINRDRPVRITNIGAAQGTLPLTKQLTAADDADLPDNITFTFNLIPTTYEIDGTVSVTHSHAINTQVTLDEDSDRDVVAGVATTTQSINLWQILSNMDFNTSGVFVWNLEEQVGSSGIVGMNYDTTRFQVRAWIDSSGEIVHVLVYNLNLVEDEDMSGTKVEPGPSFENNFDTEGDLEISKVIQGDFATLSTPFSFTLTLVDGPLAPIPAGITGQIYNHDNLPVQGPEGSINITAGIHTFTLRHGYRLFIQGLPAGTTFSVAKTAHSQFQPQAVTTVPSLGAYTVTASQGEALTTASHVVTSADSPTTVVFTNFYAWIPPTGLTIAGMSALPFIIVAFLLVATIASNKRRAIETLPLA